jgi:hypothetical protein
MSSKILRSKSIPAVVPRAISTRKSPPLADAAATLLPGLQHAASLLEVAIRVLRYFASQPPSTASRSHAAEAEKVRQLLAEFGHPVKRDDAAKGH